MNSKKCRYENVVLRDRRLFFIFAALSILMPALSLSGLLKPASEVLGVWFQRSGSTAVFFAVFAEWKAAKMFDELNPSGLVDQTLDSTRDKYLQQVKYYNYIALFLVVLGTVVWGYGDLFISMV